MAVLASSLRQFTVNPGMTPDFDVIVVGSGIGGLTAASLLAKAGQSVLILEQHDRPGGYAHSFKRKRYLFDACIHLTSGCGLTGYRGGQLIRKVLQCLGVYEQLDFIRVDPFAQVLFPDLTTSLPLSIEAWVEKLGALFPKQRSGLQALVRLCLTITEQAALADELRVSGKADDFTAQLPDLLHYRYATLADVWDHFIQDEHLKAIVAASWPYLGLPPRHISFIYWAVMMIGYLADGAYYCKGGFQQLAEALVQGLRANEGAIRYKSRVVNIAIEQNRVHALTLASGESITARSVVANADLKHTVTALIGEQHFPKRYLSRLQHLQPSLSIFVVYLATDLDLKAMGLHPEGFYYDHFDHDKHYDNAVYGRLSWLSITVPTLIDPSLAPPGQHLIMLTTLAPYRLQTEWSKVKKRFTEKMIEFAASKIAGLKNRILFVEAGSPSTLERYTGNYQGAAYGWAATPKQIGLNRLGHKAPIGGLYFAGHWTAPGGGVYGVCYSGYLAAHYVLADSGDPEIIRQLVQAVE